ncbi:MAG: hypothetical protein WCI61_07425 [Chloroflexota bacterium]
MTAAPAPSTPLGLPQRAKTLVRGVFTWMRLGAETPPRDRWRDWLLVAIVALPMIFNAITLWPEVTERVPNVNDDAFHQLMIRSASDAIARGENALDSWGPEMDAGAPRFLYYQNLPAIFVIALDRITLGQFDLFDLLNLTRWALMVGLPLTVFWSARRLEFSVVAAAGAAAAASLLSADHKYGIEFDSFVWRGWGMYTQLWAIHLSFITLACLWRLARTGRGAVAAIVAASALVVSHLLYAEMMVITGAVVVLVGLVGLDRATLRQRLAQFAAVGGAIALITSYLWVSYLQFGPYVGESPYDAAWKLDSFGATAILEWLTQGELYDHGRWPVLSIAAVAGGASLLFVHRRSRLLVATLFVVWLVLYFGRSVWGPLADHIPAGSMLLFHRFIGSFHIASILLMGMGFELVWLACTMLPRPVAALAAAVVCVGLLTPPMMERRAYYADNASWMADVTRDYQADPDVSKILATLRALPAGRTYAGLRSNWGDKMRLGQVQWYRVLVFEGMQVISPPLPSINLNSDLMFHFNDQDAVFYDLFDVRYVLAPSGLPVPDFLTPLLTTRRYTLYRAPSSGAAVFATQTVRRAADTKPNLFLQNRAWLLGADPAARSFIRWDYPAAPTAAGTPLAGCAQGAITNEVDAPASINVRTTCASAATLVFKTTYHPNWRVSVDGVEQPAFMVSPSYIGVEVPAGTHEVRAEYRSSTVRTTLLVIGFVTLALVLTSCPLGRRLLPARWRPAAPEVTT